jgi:hypothetical protein
MAKVWHAIHPHAAEHALVARIKRGRRPATHPARHLTWCGQWVEQRLVVWPGSPRRVTCAACRQAEC